MEWYNNWRNNVKTEERKKLLIDKRASIMASFLFELDTEETLKLKEESDALFDIEMESRLKKVTEEKTAIEQWFGRK